MPVAQKAAFAGGASVLQRYATRLHAVEINSSFYRPHRPATYARWAESVPETFRFSVKVPRTITHQKRLTDCDAEVVQFAGEVSALGHKLGAVLVQLPPSLPFDHNIAKSFFHFLAEAIGAPLACEPRHPSWFAEEGDALLRKIGVARVAADPAIVPSAGVPGGAGEVTYLRLHGTPRIYWSNYDEAEIETTAKLLEQASSTGPAWCVFDNTAAGFATANALALEALIKGG